MYITDYTDASEMDLEAVVSDIEEEELVTRKTRGPDIDWEEMERFNNQASGYSQHWNIYTPTWDYMGRNLKVDSPG